MRILHLLIILFVFNLMYSDTIEINIKPNYSGWVYIIKSKEKKNIKYSEGRYFPNDLGIIYVNDKEFEEMSSIVVYKENLDITDSGVTLLYMSNLLNKIPCYKFYVMTEKETHYGLSFWQNENNRSNYRFDEYRRLDSLIENKLFKIDY